LAITITWTDSSCASYSTRPVYIKPSRTILKFHQETVAVIYAIVVHDAVPLQIIKAYGILELQLHIFSTSVVGKVSRYRPEVPVG
jgi:hypothetical protein